MFGMSTRWAWFIGIATAFSANCAMVVVPSKAIAQITTDGTLPNNSIININGNTFNITGGTQAGGNLFHSFKDFSVPTGSGAFFNNTVDIQNIISRVTGGSVSNIDGFIRTLGTANLFLINPSGIVFGRNASLNVGGSFVASTANAIQFGDIGFFSATNPEAPSPLLTINPSALVSNQIAARIQNSSIAPAGLAPSGGNSSGLRVPDGRSLLLVGGNINMDGGRLRAYGGRVELGGLAERGTVGLQVDGNNLSLGFPDNVTRADVSLTNGASVRVDAAGGGSIAVNARNIDVSGRSTLTAGIGQGLGSVGAVAGDITLNATGEIKVIGRSSNVSNNVNSQAVGKGGNINVTTGSLSLTDGAYLNSSTFGQGNAGSLVVQAKNSVSLASNSSIFKTVESRAVGNGGNVQITTGSLSVTDGAQLNASTAGRGDGGSVIIDANDRVSFDGSGVFSTVEKTGVGKGGDINIKTGSLSVVNSAVLRTDTQGIGNAGNVNINAGDTVSFDAAGSKDNVTIAVYTNVGSDAKGKGGDINISARSFSVTNGAVLSTGTFGNGDTGNININASDEVSFRGTNPIGIQSAAYSNVDPTGKGNGGSINITARSLSVTDGGVLSASTYGEGNAGSVNLNARDKISIDGVAMIGSSSSTVASRAFEGARGNGGNIFINSNNLTVQDGAKITVNSQGLGDAGSIKIRAGNLTLNNQSVLSAETVSSRGGNIEIGLKDILLLRQNSQISTNAGTAKQGGDGGNITINAPSGFIVAVPGENSDITANAYTGEGGRININSLGIFNFTERSREDLVRELRTDNPNQLNPQELQTNDITAFSLTNQALSGQVIINTPDVDPSKGLLELPTVLAETLELIADTGCAAVASTDSDTEKNKFTITGRGGLPPSPYDPLSTDVIWSDTRIPYITSQYRSEKPTPKPPSKEKTVEILPATGWVFDGKGHVTLISHASNANNLRSTPACQKR